MKTKRFDTAYPGSMSEKPDGSFVEFNDVDSLAGALVKNYDDMRRSVEDWTEAAIQYEKSAQLAEQQRDELLAALTKCQVFVGELVTAGGKYSYINGSELVMDSYKMQAEINAAIAKVEGAKSCG